MSPDEGVRLSVVSSWIRCILSAAARTVACHAQTLSAPCDEREPDERRRLVAAACKRLLVTNGTGAWEQQEQKSSDGHTSDDSRTEIRVPMAPMAAFTPPTIDEDEERR
ncbi:unnamed protein product, partial [Ectocarpus sp. 12 AP-2014]